MKERLHKNWVVHCVGNTCRHIKSAEPISKKDALLYAYKNYDNVENVVSELKEPTQIELKKTRLSVTFEVDVSYHCKRDLDYILRYIKTSRKGDLIDICHQASAYAESDTYPKIKIIKQV